MSGSQSHAEFLQYIHYNIDAINIDTSLPYSLHDFGHVWPLEMYSSRGIRRPDSIMEWIAGRSIPRQFSNPPTSSTTVSVTQTSPYLKHANVPTRRRSTIFVETSESEGYESEAAGSAVTDSKSCTATSSETSGKRSKSVRFSDEHLEESAKESKKELKSALKKRSEASDSDASDAEPSSKSNTGESSDADSESSAGKSRKKNKKPQSKEASEDVSESTLADPSKLRHDPMETPLYHYLCDKLNPAQLFRLHQNSAFKYYQRFPPNWRLNMTSRILGAAHAETIICRDVIEGPNDPRPNAYFDLATSELIVYHGPRYGAQVHFGAPGFGIGGRLYAQQSYPYLQPGSGQNTNDFNGLGKSPTNKQSNSNGNSNSNADGNGQGGNSSTFDTSTRMTNNNDASNGNNAPPTWGESGNSQSWGNNGGTAASPGSGWGHSTNSNGARQDTASNKGNSWTSSSPGNPKDSAAPSGGGWGTSNSSNDAAANGFNSPSNSNPAKPTGASSNGVAGWGSSGNPPMPGSWDSPSPSAGQNGWDNDFGSGNHSSGNDCGNGAGDWGSNTGGNGTGSGNTNDNGGWGGNTGGGWGNDVGWNDTNNTSNHDESNVQSNW